MKRKTIFLVAGIIALVFALSLSNATTSANPTNGYMIDWYTVDGGGTMSAAGGSYTLNGAIGQSDAGTQSGGNHKLNGGFWGFLDSLRQLFLPLILR